MICGNLGVKKCQKEHLVMRSQEKAAELEIWNTIQDSLNQLLHTEIEICQYICTAEKGYSSTIKVKLSLWMPQSICRKQRFSSAHSQPCHLIKVNAELDAYGWFTPAERSPWKPLNVRLGGLQARLNALEKTKSLATIGNWSVIQFLCCPVHNLVTILAELSQLLYWNYPCIKISYLKIFPFLWQYIAQIG